MQIYHRVNLNTKNKFDRTINKKDEKMKIYLIALMVTVSLCFTSVLAQPNQEWVVRHNGLANSWDLAEAIVLDKIGNIYVSGRSTYPGESYDLVTIKYSPDGDTLWSARYTGSTHEYDGASDICVDDSFYVYVTGYCDLGFFGGDWITIKYNPDGSEAWNRVYSGGSGSAIVLDSEGNVIVTGSAGYPSDITTIKYNPAGDSLWIRFYNGPLNGNDNGQDVTVDKDDNIYVTGDVEANSGTYVYANYATIKYNPDGDSLWVAIYDPFGLWADTPIEILLDDSGDVYVFGSSASTEMNADFALVKYDSSNGAQIWDARYDGGSTDLATGMALDPYGNIIITGGSMIPGIPGHYNYTTIKYDSGGNQNWVRQYDGPANKWDWPYTGVAVDRWSNIYVGGRSQGLGDDYDYATVSYDSGGIELWVMRYDGPANDQDYGDGGVVVDSNLNVYVTGNSKGIGTGADYTTIKYSNPVEIDNGVSGVSTDFALGQNYPNPFNPETVIHYHLAATSAVNLTIYNMLGQKVCTLVNMQQSVGSYSVQWNGRNDADIQVSSGIYLYRLKAGNPSSSSGQVFVETKKMLLVR